MGKKAVGVYIAQEKLGGRKVGKRRFVKEESLRKFLLLRRISPVFQKSSYIRPFAASDIGPCVIF